MLASHMPLDAMSLQGPYIFTSACPIIFYSSQALTSSITFSINFFAGFIVSSLVYWVLNRIFPVPATSNHWNEIGDQITEISLVYDEPDPDVYDEESGSMKSAKMHPHETHVSEAR